MCELVPLHHAEEYFERCFQLLNHQWPRLASVRMGMLRLSRDSLPTSLVLVEDHKVIGHIKIKQLFSRCRALWIESVVIDKALRGKGYGKILMLETEKYARKMGFENAYLATYDQQGFYSRLGYEECEKVCVFDKPIEDDWVPDISFLKKMSWNVNPPENGFSKLNTSNCNGTSHQNSNGTIYKPKNSSYNNKKHSSTNGYHHKNFHKNFIEDTIVQIDENGWYEIEVKTINGNCSASSAIPTPPPPPPRPVMPLQYLNGVPVPPPPPPPPPKAPPSIPTFKKIPAVSLSPIKEGVAVPPPPPKSESEANNFLLISSLLSNDGEGIKTFMKKSLI